MTHRSTTDPTFLATLAEWLRARPEILVLIRYSRMAGARNFELFTVYEALAHRLHRLGPQTSVIAFREPQLPIRGTVDDCFIATCLSAIPEGSEYLVLDSARTTSFYHSWFHHSSGDTHVDFREDLEDLRGHAVAVGPYPPWLEDTVDVISAIVPFEQGQVAPGIY